MFEEKESQKQLAPKCFEPVSSLLRKKFPPIQECVPGLLSSGLVILTGRPHSGNSLLALQLALSVAAGEPFLGHFPTNKGWVQYYALECGKRQLQNRLNDLGFKSLGEHACRRFLYDTTLEPGTPLENLITRAASLIEIYNSFWATPTIPFRLFVVDTMDNALLWNVVDYDKHGSLYGWLVDMNRLADEMDITILFVHHMRKNWMSDPLDRIFGPEGVYGACDTSLLLERGRLYVFPRGSEEKRLRIEREGVGWKYVDKC